ncbi:hypothetical protein CFIMG_008141RA00001 [Ceratocystis fimbriata CBS 114723]|uniref:Uncharacterized protein n=1 Tax=Ceratocystis fimbriata CBS 114723 TaxID=1035309 RepID=A0A2C5X6M6_9PEZI|nr:hypothetical protein CFIMG_008141RA00001 [Ceratocystis fimbriata CBS 114723]
MEYRSTAELPHLTSNSAPQALEARTFPPHSYKHVLWFQAFVFTQCRVRKDDRKTQAEVSQLHTEHYTSSQLPV